MKCFIVRPIHDLDEVMDWLNSNKISYNVVHEDNIIFANLEKKPDGLMEIAVVTDPVVRDGNEWAFFGNDQDETDLTGPYKSENAARAGFKKYISWVGEFVDNS